MKEKLTFEGEVIFIDKVVHFEIPADDLARAKRFYAENFGRNIFDAAMPGMEYLMVNTVATDEKNLPQEAGAINGGMMKRQYPGETPVLVVSVANLDESLAKVTASGAKVVMPKMPVGEMGLYARVTDTEGNVIGLWQDLN